MQKKMKANKINFVLFFSICTTYLVSGEQFYIVTSPGSPCPTREQGEPCLTLEQYTTNPSLTSNVTLVMESGNHFLKESRRSIGSNFSLVSEGPGANIIFDNNAGLTFHQDYYYAMVTTVMVSGITFSSTSGHAEIRFEFSRELIIQDCNFQGIKIYTYYVTNVTFLRCTFSDYHNYSNYQGALFISRSAVVSVIESNFTNNTRAIYFDHYYSYYHYTRTSLVVLIQKCSFINNTSEHYGGGAIL